MVPVENGGGPRNYLGNMGKGITADIRTYMPEPTDDAQPDNESNENEHEDDNQFAAFSQQVINNSLLIQQKRGQQYDPAKLRHNSNAGQPAVLWNTTAWRTVLCATADKP